MDRARGRQRKMAGGGQDVARDMLVLRPMVKDPASALTRPGRRNTTQRLLGPSLIGPRYSMNRRTDVPGWGTLRFLRRTG